MPKRRVMIIEDDPDILEIMRYILAREGYEVSYSENGDLGFRLLLQNPPDLVMLDLLLPGMDGLEICRQLRADPSTQNIQIIIVTAKCEESDIVLGLGMGADDYVAKPFSPFELAARVKSAMRRVDQKDSSDALMYISAGSLEIDCEEFSVTISGQPLKLTLAEFKILKSLATKPGRVLTREQLIKNYSGDHAVVEDRNIDVHIRSIRKALGEHRDIVETVRGVGYRLTTKLD